MPLLPNSFPAARLLVFLLRLVVVVVALGVASLLRAEMDATLPPPVEAPIDPDAWLEEIADTLAIHYRTEGEWSLELVRDYTPPAEAIIEVTEMPPKPASQMMLRLQVHALDGTSTHQTVFVRAKIWRDAWIAREPLTREANIDEHMLELRRVDILRQRDLVPVDTPLADLMMSRSLPADRFLSWRDVSRRPLVRKGQMIEVAAVDGTLAITMKALALQDGLAGELVRVRNTESRREFAAVVTAQGQAEVHF
ncbi:flagellar basal body P-ring formation chaperone FlgA [Actomonas aquatica]|uniref:Flagellar basal body P-ring formation chaperone FlgA n=1 Tax=Actomonas aquatica TaxID=2866162 RepID=A0ABZ1C815_9BACT|nr:flagellar basal body P-ring formation chaperone FlgA [Opitutus sp. WL0086]WRQ87603.1 flagellar basal body P-ring formation chaperone FlgA [Opitutus sp. WL0086]